MTSTLLVFLGFALFFGGTIHTIRRAIRASNRNLEAQRRKLHEMQMAEAARTATKPERTHKKEKRAPHQVSQPTKADNTAIKQLIKHQIKEDITEDFDLRKAIIASEILHPKFDE